MLLVVQLVWVVLVQRSDYFCYLCIRVLTVLDRDVCMKGVDMGGGCLLHVVGLVVWRCGLR